VLELAYRHASRKPTRGSSWGARLHRAPSGFTLERGGSRRNLDLEGHVLLDWSPDGERLLFASPWFIRRNANVNTLTLVRASGEAMAT
jgi:hypothetical protein